MRNYRTIEGHVREVEEHGIVEGSGCTIDKDWKTKLENKKTVEYYGRYVPSCNPNNRLITRHEREEILDYCIRREEDLIKECPVVACDTNFFDSKKNDTKTKLEPADTMDTQHIIIAMSYCDFFITGDKNLHNKSMYVRNMTLWAQSTFSGHLYK